MAAAKEVEDVGSDTFEDAKDNATTRTPQDTPTPAPMTSDEEKTSKRASQADSAKVMEDVPLDESSTLQDAADKTVPNGGDIATDAVDSNFNEESIIDDKDNRKSGGQVHSSDLKEGTSDSTSAPKLQIPDSHPILSPDANEDTPASPPAKRKLFGWLSRTTSSSDKAGMRVPSLPFRSAQNPNLSINEEQDFAKTASTSPINKRSSLQERFKLVRMKEEAGVDIEGVGLGQDDFMGRSQSVDTSKVQKREEESAATRMRRANSVAGIPQLTNGASNIVKEDAAESVDWDLWQEVVNEGPAAVSRRSSKELNDAITRGIPSAIRGVIWQVLAQSKDENLEEIYRSLVARQGGEEIPPTTRRARPRLPPAPGDRTSIGSRRSSILSTTIEQPETILAAESSVQSPSEEVPPANEAAPTSQSNADSTITAEPSVESAAVEDAKVLDKLTIQKLERAIKRDMGTRTSYSKFLMSAGLQDGLFGICKAYALYDEEVGYAQGMNFIAMPLLFTMPEEEAFCLFVRLMNQYQLRYQFVPEMPGLHLHLYQFERLLEDLEPAVYCHLHRRGVSPQLYATQWFLTLFAYRFPLQLVLRIYDLILSEGLESAILKFGIVLMQKNAAQLLKMRDMVELTSFLKERLFDVYIDKSPSAKSVLESGFFGSAGGIDKEVYQADALVQDACAIHITPETLKAYSKEWEDKVRDEKDKEAAEEALRATNATLSLKVRVLEERAEKSDKEHVEMASELVRIKVTNQHLMDENDGLKMQVEQLQAIVDAQPGQVEATLRAEMDRIMARNIEVQNENRSLEDSQAEMEKELVTTKMAFAEQNSELEDMRMKWAGMTSLMNSK